MNTLVYWSTIKKSISYDLMVISSPHLPKENYLSKLDIREYSTPEIYRLKDKGRSFLYRYRAKGNGVVLHYGTFPQLNAGYMKNKQLPAASLTLNIGNLAYYEVMAIAAEVFGTLEGLKISYLESRIDFYNIDFDTVAKSLLVLDKQRIITYRKGETEYYGSPSSRHEIIIYDKGLKTIKIPNSWIRVEAKNWFRGEDRPLLTDFFNGIWRLDKPFKRAFIVNQEKLGLKTNEKKSLAKQSLTKFYSNIKTRSRKEEIREKAKKSIIINFNEIFTQWENEWLPIN